MVSFSTWIILLLALAVGCAVAWVSSERQRKESFVPEPPSSTQEDKPKLTCIVSGNGGEKYCVRDTSKKAEAASLLARVTAKCQELIEAIARKYPDNKIGKQLRENFDASAISETLPNTEYTAFSENKGEKISFCLTPQKDNETEGLIDEHTLVFVALHELTHVGSPSIGHGPEFWENFKYVLERAREFGIHDPRDYKIKPAKYCSTMIRDNPYFDM